MTNYLSRAEINTIGEGIMDRYARFTNVNNHIDIDHFVINYLKLNIIYTSFAEEDKGKIGFLADGKTPLLIYDDGGVVPFVFPKDTIVIDRFLLSEKEEGRRRFTVAHEAAHYILNQMQKSQNRACFHNEFDSERTYTKRELEQMFAGAEWQADTMGATFLMPHKLIEKNIERAGLKIPITIYSSTVFTGNDKVKLRNAARTLGVSYTALLIRLRDLNMLEYKSIDEYLETELGLRGGC